MRPRTFSDEQAALVIRVFDDLHSDGKSDCGPYYYNQYMAAEEVIALFWMCWDVSESGQMSGNLNGLDSLAEILDVDTGMAMELSTRLIRMTPRALVQQVKRWRNRIGKH